MTPKNFWLVAVGIALAAIGWGVIAIYIDVWRDGFYLLANWSEVPEIMRARVPAYAATVFIGTLLALTLVAFATRFRKRAPTGVDLLFVVGATWASFTFVVVQINTAADEIGRYKFLWPISGLTVEAGWILLLVTLGISLYRASRRKP